MAREKNKEKGVFAQNKNNLYVVYFLLVLIPIICIILAGCFVYFS